MNASIYCAILKEKSHAPKEKIKGVSKTAGGSVATTGHLLAVRHACKQDSLADGAPCGGRQHDRQHQAAKIADRNRQLNSNSRRQEPTIFLATLSKGNSAMAVYMIADIKVTDNNWVPAYAASVHDLVHKHGGKYLSRSGNVKTLEGKPLDTSLIAILHFPSGEAVSAFLADPKYAPFAAARKDGSESRFQLIDDTDLAGTISYLPKG
jgi:uncharacterized protein (DUF1330 family)